MPLRGPECHFSHPPPNSLVIQAATKWAHQQHPRSIPADKEGKHLDLLSHKVFSSINLEFCILNYLTLFAKYNFLTYGKHMDFTDKLLLQDQARFQALLEEGKLVARTTLQATVDAADTSSHMMAKGIVMHRESWLHSFNFLKEIQTTIEDLPLMSLTSSIRRLMTLFTPSRTLEQPSGLWVSTHRRPSSNSTIHLQPSGSKLPSFSKDPMSLLANGRGPSNPILPVHCHHNLLHLTLKHLRSAISENTKRVANYCASCRAPGPPALADA